MARNRKRAKERRARRPAAGQLARPGVATARAEREDRDRDDERDETPSPIAHATPDVELADAQLALGRPELAGDPVFGGPGSASGSGSGHEAELAADDDLADDGFEADVAASGGARTSEAATLAPAGAESPAPRGLSANRLVTFLQGSWRELQRVQWPDRRQVMQATGVVIGFVIVAGVYLGVADALAGKLVTLILK